jgi:hypothetical protein
LSPPNFQAFSDEHNIDYKVMNFSELAKAPGFFEMAMPELRATANE